MESTKKWKKFKFSTILWAFACILLCCTTCFALEVQFGSTLDLDYAISGDWLDVYGTLNMNPNAYVDWGIHAYSGSTVNIYAGNIGAYSYIQVDNGANVTVYGTNFAVDGVVLDPSVTQFTPVPPPSGDGSATLTGSYENGDSINLLFFSDVPILLVPPGTPNLPPVAIAGQEGLIGPGGKIHPIYSSEQDITIVLGQANDPEGQPIEYRWLEGETPLMVNWAPVGTTEVPEAAYLDLSTIDPFSLGDHILTLEVKEVGGEMLESSDDMTLIILNTPPDVQPTSTYIIVNLGDSFSIGANLADFDGDELTYEWRKGATVIASGEATPPSGGDSVSITPLEGTGGTSPFALGINELVIAVSDGVNPEEVSEVVTVEVSDTDAPTLAPTASETMLWPPNNTLIPIIIQANAEDNSGGPITLDVQVTSNESDENDWVIDSIDNTTGEIQLRLRAERSGSGDGRVYTVTITATDEANNSSTAIVEIRVPHDKRKN